MKTTMESVYRLQVYKSEKVYKVPKIGGIRVYVEKWARIPVLYTRKSVPECRKKPISYSKYTSIHLL